MKMKELFEQKTHIDPDYFLGMILTFLDQYPDEDLAPPEKSTIFCVDEKNYWVGQIVITKNSIVITKA